MTGTPTGDPFVTHRRPGSTGRRPSAADHPAATGPQPLTAPTATGPAR